MVARHPGILRRRGQSRLRDLAMPRARAGRHPDLCRIGVRAVRLRRCSGWVRRRVRGRGNDDRRFVGVAARRCRWLRRLGLSGRCSRGPAPFRRLGGPIVGTGGPDRCGVRDDGGGQHRGSRWDSVRARRIGRRWHGGLGTGSVRVAVGATECPGPRASRGRPGTTAVRSSACGEGEPGTSSDMAGVHTAGVERRWAASDHRQQRGDGLGARPTQRSAVGAQGGQSVALMSAPRA